MFEIVQVLFISLDENNEEIQLNQILLFLHSVEVSKEQLKVSRQR